MYWLVVLPNTAFLSPVCDIHSIICSRIIVLMILVFSLAVNIGYWGVILRPFLLPKLVRVIVGARNIVVEC